MTRCARHGLCLAALAVVGACDAFSVDPDAIGSIELEPPPYPAIVTGDTLRDANGRVAPFVARVFAADGSPLTDRTVTYLATLGHIAITGDGVARAIATAGTDRIVAIVDGLQSLPRQISIVQRPESLVRSGSASLVSLVYSVPPGPSDTTTSLAVRVTTATGGGVGPWIVSYRILRDSLVLPSTDTTAAYVVVDDAGRPTAVDTTTEAGAGSRRLRYRFRTGARVVDTVRVEVRASYRGLALKGSGVTFTVIARPLGSP